MTTTLITGANRGLGFETARQLVAAGHTVYLGARDADRGQQAAARIGARPLPLDVTSEESVRKAAKLVESDSGQLDVLVNNAGIPGSIAPAGDITAADVAAVCDTNLLGPVRVTHAFLPLLRVSSQAVVVNVSSGLGSITAAVDPVAHADLVPGWLPALPYASSKAALNMITVQYAHVFPGMRINAVDPGLTATDFNNHAGNRTVTEGAEIIVRMATIGADGPSGGYFSADGRVPW